MALQTLTPTVLPLSGYDTRRHSIPHFLALGEFATMPNRTSLTVLILGEICPSTPISDRTCCAAPVAAASLHRNSHIHVQVVPGAERDGQYNDCIRGRYSWHA
jgi:hypothetical protein